MRIVGKGIYGILATVLLVFSAELYGQSRNVNYDESKVPIYTLPELLVSEKGKPIQSVKDWEKIRRPELLQLFAKEMYGSTPKDKIQVTYEFLERDRKVYDGKAIREQVRFTFSNGAKKIEAILLLIIPTKLKNGKAPFIVGYNFKGNHSTMTDTLIHYSPGMFYAKPPDHPDWVRGCQSNRWPFELIIDQGYGVATMNYHDIFPDKDGTKDHSIVSLFKGYGKGEQAQDEWQAIGAWAWGSSRILDYLYTRPFIDKEQIVLMGHSRQGKAALWAGAQDERFKIVISNNSGSGGAAISRRAFGETVKIVSNIKPAWFAPAFNKYHDNEPNLPFDQHQLIALMAPRPVYVASAQEDLWADPKGEFLAAFHAGPVYKLYNLTAIESPEMPAVNQPIMTHVGYHIRTGKHDVTEFDWNQFIKFADLHFKNKGR